MFTDPRVLTNAAYAGAGPLSARIAIYAYQQDRVDLPGLVVEQLRDRRGLSLTSAAGRRPTSSGCRGNAQTCSSFLGERVEDRDRRSAGHTVHASAGGLLGSVTRY